MRHYIKEAIDYRCRGPENERPAYCKNSHNLMNAGAWTHEMSRVLVNTATPLDATGEFIKCPDDYTYKDQHFCFKADGSTEMHAYWLSEDITVLHRGFEKQNAIITNDDGAVANPYINRKKEIINFTAVSVEEKNNILTLFSIKFRPKRYDFLANFVQNKFLFNQILDFVLGRPGLPTVSS